MEEIKKEKKIIEIYPTKLSRRVLCFFSDIFLNLILSVIIFELVVFQISRPITKFDSKVNQNETYQKNIYDLLYEHEILYFDKDEDGSLSKYNLSNALEDTYYHFVNFLVDDDNEELVKYEIFYKYFVEIKENGSVNELNKLYDNYASNYFNKDQLTILGTYSLKEEYKDEFKHNYIEDDEMSIKGYEDYNNFLNNSFLNLYNEIFNDIKENDLYSLNGNLSYSFLRGEINKLDNEINNNYIVCSYVSFLLSNIILFFIYPLFNPKRNTISERVLKLERINKHTMEYIKRSMVTNIFLLKMIDSLCLLFLIPVLRVGFSYIFALPILYLPSLIGILIALINLIITGFSKLNTSLKEITTDSIVVNEDSLNNYYEEISTYGK